jgi:two-component system, OmpR family, sensor kinase
VSSAPAPSRSKLSRLKPRWIKRPKRWSLRSRLLAGVLALVAAGFVVADVASVALLRSYLTDRIDEQLYLVQEAAERTPKGELNDDQDDWLDSDRAKALLDSYSIELYDRDGTLIDRMLTTDQRGRPDVPTLDLQTARQLGYEPFYTQSVNRHHPGYRVILVRLPAFPGAPDGGTGLIAYDLTHIAKTMGHLGVIEVVVTVLVLVTAAVIGTAVIRVGLRPLTEVETTAEEIIAGGDLGRRVPAEAAPATEMGRLSRTLNTMLTEIEASFAERREAEARLRQFVADASHELRTPLAGIRGLAELHRQGAVTDPAEVSALLARVEAEATRMGLLVDDLLLLARMDEERPLRNELVDLVPIAADCLEAARLRDADRPMRLELLDGADPVVQGDSDRLQQVATNLIGNALAHTPPGTPVTVRTGVQDGQALFEVVDAGQGLASEHADRVFERFYRVDRARSRDHARTPSTGSGLGLSIVAALVHAHGGTVRHLPTPGGGATFRVLLPLSPA